MEDSILVKIVKKITRIQVLLWINMKKYMNRIWLQTSQINRISKMDSWNRTVQIFKKMKTPLRYDEKFTILRTTFFWSSYLLWNVQEWSKNIHKYRRYYIADLTHTILIQSIIINGKTDEGSFNNLYWLFAIKLTRKGILNKNIF